MYSTKGPAGGCSSGCQAQDSERPSPSLPLPPSTNPPGPEAAGEPGRSPGGAFLSAAAAAGFFPPAAPPAGGGGASASFLAMHSALVMSAAAWSSSFVSMASGRGLSGVTLRPMTRSLDNMKYGQCDIERGEKVIVPFCEAKIWDYSALPSLSTLRLQAWYVLMV